MIQVLRLVMVLALLGAPGAAQAEPSADRDGDGIRDDADACPDAAEDKDGFDDLDGCPDPDNDQDGVADVDDKCPNQAEDRDGRDDEDGCPETGARVKGKAIELLDEIYFAPNSAEILPQSHRVLDALAALLAKERWIKRIEIGSHTDSRGSDAYNLKMSQLRADAVRTYLIAAHVAKTRLVARGYGETRPLDPRPNAAAWAKNRRTEIVILAGKK